MPNIQVVLRRVNELREKGFVEQYAIGDAWASTYFSEPILTEDLDVFCLGYKPAGGGHADSILIEDVPVQFLVGNALIDEAIENAVEINSMLQVTTRPINEKRLDLILEKHAPQKPKLGEKTLLDRWTRLKDGRQ
jgi:hypothetical protein